MFTELGLVVCTAIFAAKIYIIVSAMRLKGQKELVDKSKDIKLLAMQNKDEVNWTRFFDMSSKGKSQLVYDAVIVQAKRDLAITIFNNRFEIDPLASSYNGGVGMEDFVITTHFSLEEAKDGLDCFKIYVIPEDKINYYDINGFDGTGVLFLRPGGT